MDWSKRGLIFAPDGTQAWMRTHAALPVPLHLHDDTYRVYVSGRNADGRAQIGYVEIDLNDPSTTITISDDPVIPLGRLGAHDDCGVTSACIVPHDGRLYQYYTGWTLGETVPFFFHIGLAISNDNGQTFEKISEGPILGRTRTDPYVVASPFVMLEEGRWRMWYISGARWEATESGPKHFYHIRYAESADGIDWNPTGIVCIDFEDDEYAFARPVVVKSSDGLYRMWYSVRGDAYRIGYAESEDGITWKRLDSQAGIDVSSDGWDSEMLAYPYVFEHRGSLYMLYNGNGYGRTGVGLAVETDV